MDDNNSQTSRDFTESTQSPEALRESVLPPVNVAIIGESGVGKSSFVNTIRGIAPTDERAAKVGTAETTRVEAAYTHSENSLIKLWDLPGVGCPGFGKEKYFHSVEIDRYDFFLLLSCSRFHATDAWLTEEIQKRKKRFFFVRTKVDEDIASEQYENAHVLESIILEQIRKDIVTNLKRLRPDVCENEVFLITNRNRTKYDFPSLEKRLFDEMKQFGPAFPPHKPNEMGFEETLQQEQKLFNQREAHIEKTFNVLGGDIRERLEKEKHMKPFESDRAKYFLDPELVLRVAKNYLIKFSLDEENLRKQADETQTNFLELKAIVCTTFPSGEPDEDTLVKFADELKLKTSKYRPSCSMTTASIQNGTCQMLQKVLEELKVTALKVNKLMSQ